MIWFGKTKNLTYNAATTNLILSSQSRSLALVNYAKAFQAIQHRGAAHVKMMGQSNKIMHLNILAPRFHTPLHMQGRLPIIYIHLAPAGATLGEAVHEGSDSVLRHQKRSGECIGSHFVEIGSVARTTQHAADFPIKKHMSVFVRTRKAPAQDMVLPINRNQHAMSGIDQSQSGYIVGQVHLCSADTLALKKIDYIRQRSIPKIEAVALLRCYERSLLNRIPFGIRRRNRIDRNGS